MTYEEKREFHKIISQMLADEGLNRGRIKEIVEEEIRKKVNQVVDQTISNLDAQTEGPYDGFIEQRVIDTINNDLRFNRNIVEYIKRELQNRIIEIKFSDSVVSKLESIDHD